MSDAVILALAASVTQIIVAGFGMWVALKGLRKVGVKVEEIHKATNSITERLLASTKAEAHTAGVKEERDRTEAHTAGVKNEKNRAASHAEGVADERERAESDR